MACRGMVVPPRPSAVPAPGPRVVPPPLRELQSAASQSSMPVAFGADGPIFQLSPTLLSIPIRIRGLPPDLFVKCYGGSLIKRPPFVLRAWDLRLKRETKEKGIQSTCASLSGSEIKEKESETETTSAFSLGSEPAGSEHTDDEEAWGDWLPIKSHAEPKPKEEIEEVEIEDERRRLIAEMEDALAVSRNRKRARTSWDDWPKVCFAESNAIFALRPLFERSCKLESQRCKLQYQRSA